jgi:hypothetical protein
MKTTKYNGITYQLDESKFKPAYIKFDQDMFNNEILPVLVGLGFEIRHLDGNRDFLTNEYNTDDFDFSKTSVQSSHRKKCHTATEFLNASGIFAVADELPKYWYIEVTEENLEELDTWRKSVASLWLGWSLKAGYFVLSKHYNDESYVWFAVNENEMLSKHPTHQKIDLETFRKITKNMEKSFTITAEQAQSIINIACTNWKKKLAEKWANDIVLGKDIQISEEFYKEMRAACTSEQNKLFDEIFGKVDDGSVDLSEMKRYEIARITNAMIEVRGSSEYMNKAFYLSPCYDWEIKNDSVGTLCLIPTKKK